MPFCRLYQSGMSKEGLSRLSAIGPPSVQKRQTPPSFEDGVCETQRVAACKTQNFVRIPTPYVLPEVWLV